jgi:hypothetical protein
VPLSRIDGVVMPMFGGLHPRLEDQRDGFSKNFCRDLSRPLSR